MAFRIPSATYRLQFNREFTFREATEIADYLQELGVSDCYASPLLPGTPQSTHGYDICCYDKLNPSLGGVDRFERFAARLTQLGLGLLLDMVPNHMAADPSNCWWRDVLEKGMASSYADWFDIDWQPPNPSLTGKVLLPILEAPYGNVLEAGKLKVVFEKEHFALAYYDRQFPLSLAKPAAVLAQSIRRVNGIPGVPQTFDQLHSLLQQQHYRLAFWRVGPQEINYRRFFDITGLVSLRMELPEVFEATHGLVLELIRQGKITGLRVDHPDGLWNPKQYFERLQSACPNSPQEMGQCLYVVAEKILTGEEALPCDWPVAGTTGYDFLNRVNGLFVNGANRGAIDAIYRDFTGEKRDFQSVLQAGKRQVLLNSFSSELNALVKMLKAIAGGTRYGLDFTTPILREALIEILIWFPVYRNYISEETVEPTSAEAENVRAAISSAQNQAKSAQEGALQFIGDLLTLHLPHDLQEGVRKLARKFVMKFQQLTGPLTAKGLEDTAFYNFNRLISLNEVGGDPDHFGTDPEQFHAYNAANAKHWPHTLLATATHDTKRGEDARARINVIAEMPQEWRQTVLRWKGLNAEKKCVVGERRFPEATDEYLLYQSLVGAWPPEIHASSDLQKFTDRIAAYMVKATREAKAHSSWTEPNSLYEHATTTFVHQVLSSPASDSFLTDFKQFHKKIAYFGCLNSLAQTLIKMTAPGVPDFYQGTELWDFSLVDPDNRRPVDFQHRRDLLIELKNEVAHASDLPATLRQFLNEFRTGKIKTYLIWRTLQFRREHRQVFDEGAYVPLLASGAKKEHVFAFARLEQKNSVIVVVPRLVIGLTRGAEHPPIGRELWQDTYVRPMLTKATEGGQSRRDLLKFRPSDRYRNILTGEIVKMDQEKQGLAMADVLSSFPVGLLEFVP